MDCSSQNNKKYKVVLAATGSVASIKIVQLAAAIQKIADIKVIATKSALKFIDLEQLKAMNIQFYDDDAETLMWNKRGDPVLHIELRKWANTLVIAPLSANTLAKIANGFCDNLVTLVCRCWDMCLREEQLEENIEKQSIQSRQKKLKRPIIICPAMNSMMWSHPVTTEHLLKLKNWGFTVVDPIQKQLMCGDNGKGAMASVQAIIDCLLTEKRLL